MSKAAVFFINGFEEVEAIAPVDILRRGGVQVDTVSLTGENSVTGSHNIKIETDKLYNEITWDYDMLILPGGPGTEGYLKHESFIERLKETSGNRIRIAAICAAPSILGRLGLLKGKKAVAYPGYERLLEGADVLFQDVVTDSNITTSRGAGTAMEFGFELLMLLEGEEKMKEVEQKIVFKNNTTDVKK